MRSAWRQSEAAPTRPAEAIGGRGDPNEARAEAVGAARTGPARRRARRLGRDQGRLVRATPDGISGGWSGRPRTGSAQAGQGNSDEIGAEGGDSDEDESDAVS